MTKKSLFCRKRDCQNRPYFSPAFRLAIVLVLVVGLSFGAAPTQEARVAPGTWAFTDNLNTGRQGHSATLLPDGKVPVAGGYDGSGKGGKPETCCFYKLAENTPADRLCDKYYRDFWETLLYNITG